MARKNKKKNNTKIPIVKEIRDDTIFLRDRTILAVFEITPVEFDKLNESKKHDIMKKYKIWLESLEYPVQIVARLVNIDTEKQVKILKNKVEHLIKQKTEYRDLMNLFKEYEEWFDNYLKNNTKSRKIYYLVIPYMNLTKPTFFEKFRKAKLQTKYDFAVTQLNKRIEGCIKILESTGVKAHRLSTEQIQNLYWSYFSIHNQIGKNQDLKYIGSEEWFKQWKNDMENKE